MQFTLKSVGYDAEKLPHVVRAVTTAWDVKMEQEAKTRHTERCPVCHRFIRHGERHNHTADDIARAAETAQHKELPSVFSDTPLPAGTICRGPKSTRYIVLPFDVKAEASLPCGLCGLCGLGVCAVKSNAVRMNGEIGITLRFILRNSNEARIYGNNSSG